MSAAPAAATERGRRPRTQVVVEIPASRRSKENLSPTAPVMPRRATKEDILKDREGSRLESTDDEPEGSVRKRKAAEDATAPKKKSKMVVDAQVVRDH